MKRIDWMYWLLLAYCIYLYEAEAKSKIRRPVPPPHSSTLMLKMSRPIAHRVSTGNTVHIGGNFPHQRVPYKHANHRIRRPITFNVLSTNWKNPIRPALNNRAVLPQHGPVKDFHFINKIPEYSPEYRPELVALPPTHRGSIDDDKGPIHTIPAPNLSPADKPYDSMPEGILADRPPHSSDLVDYRTIVQKPVLIPYGLAATLGNGLSPQRTATSSTPSRYEVTENNDVGAKDEYHSQHLDITGLSTAIAPHSQSNAILLNHPLNANTVPPMMGPNVQIAQSSIPMQTNLRTSLHVGFPSSVVHQQSPYTVAVAPPTPDLHVGHPAPAAGPPLSATQLYDLLNGLPGKLAEPYASDQQRILLNQQQFGQIFQPDTTMTFPQPQMHSFNYDEQSNKLQQQQLLLQQQPPQRQHALSDSHTDSSAVVEAHKRPIKPFTYPNDGDEQFENNIEYDERNRPVRPTTYFDKMANAAVISTEFYTTLPSREAAEKLAALAAAGNVNSRLIGQLRQQQERHPLNDDPMPLNHKNHDDPHDSYTVQSNEKTPLQITVHDNEDDYVIDHSQSNIRNDNVDIEYEYEGEDEKTEDSAFSALSDRNITSRDQDPRAEFGSRLRPKATSIKK